MTVYRILRHERATTLTSTTTVATYTDSDVASILAAALESGAARELRRYGVTVISYTVEADEVQG